MIYVIDMKMIRSVFLVVSISLLLVSAPQQTYPVETEPNNDAGLASLKETLIALEKKSWEAWQARDARFFESFLADDHVELHGNGPIDRKGVLAKVASPSCVVKSYALDKFQLTSINPETALLTYWAKQETVCSGNTVPSPAWVSSLYVRRNGRWLNLFYQQTPAR